MKKIAAAKLNQNELTVATTATAEPDRPAAAVGDHLRYSRKKQTELDGRSSGRLASFGRRPSAAAVSYRLSFFEAAAAAAAGFLKGRNNGSSSSSSNMWPNGARRAHLQWPPLLLLLCTASVKAAAVRVLLFEQQQKQQKQQKLI